MLIIVAAVLMLMCSVHAQPEASLQNVSANEIISEITSGEPVDYENVSIQGDLDLSNLREPVSREVRISNCQLDRVNFGNVTLEQSLDMRGTVFQESTNFAKAKFLSDTSFSGARFLGATDFRDTDFGESISFTSAQFLNDTSFTNAQFNGDTSFLNSSFIGDVDFDYAQFSRTASFWSAAFRNVSFMETNFEAQTTFGYAQFNGKTLFVGTNFGNDAIFRSSAINGNSTFGLARFDGLCDFSDVSFKGMAIFLGTKFTDNVYFTGSRFNRDLILEGARIYSIKLDNVTFGEDSKISLKDADFSRFIVRWNTIKDRMIFDGAAYQSLVKNYKDLGWFNDADDCYYQYRLISQIQEPWNWAKLEDIIAWLSCGYGVRVSYILFWCIFTILSFGIIFWAGNGARRFKYVGQRGPGNAGDIQDTGVSLIDAMYFSVANFATAQAPVNYTPVGIYKQLAVIEIVLGFFFSMLFVVVLVSILIR